MKYRLLSILLAGVFLSTSATAQFARPGQAIKFRKSVMYLMNTHFNRIGAMVEGKAPMDAKVLSEYAALIETLSKLPWQAYGPGTDKGEETNAKPEIWKEPAKFKAAGESLMADTTKLALAARSGNLDTIKSTFAATAKSCKNCHDAFVDE